MNNIEGKYLTFLLKNEIYGISISSVKEINDKKKQASLWNSFNDESEGRITFMENEERFRYRKNL